MTIQKIETWMKLIVLLGIMLAICFVMIGGFSYLMIEGQNQLPLSLLQLEANHSGINQAWHMAFSFSPLGMIQLGLLILVLTQILRIALLACFYAVSRDEKFTLMSTFILFVLIYS